MKPFFKKCKCRAVSSFIIGALTAMGLLLSTGYVADTCTHIMLQAVTDSDNLEIVMGEGDT